MSLDYIVKHLSQKKLYHYCKGKGDERAFDELVDNIIEQDLALKAVLEHAELLVFTSLQLPLQNWSKLCCHYVLYLPASVLIELNECLNDLFAGYRGKYYLWGLFGRQKLSHYSSRREHATA
ncbi:hypothetical protein NC652_014178 [Populus alba x Populus x berolinensis]|nr:hypothetical protein NC652_014178 [Populus alba x Populus x berolinensis]